MLHLYISQTETITLEVIDPHITYKWNGINTFEFNIPTTCEQYRYLKEESAIKCNGTFFNVKKINEQSNLTSVECELNLDDFKATCFDFVSETQSFDITLDQLLIGTGCTTQNAESVTLRRSIELKDTNIMNVLTECQEVYNVVLNYDNINKVLYVIKYDNIQPSGVYLTDELNLKELSFKGNS